MWCHYCRKADHHTDAQCLCARPADWVPKPEDREPVPRDRSMARVLAEMADNRALVSTPRVVTT